MSVILVLAAVALRRPWIGFMLWVWLSLMNPHRYTWGFANSAPVAAIAAASVLIGMLLTKDRESPFKGPTVAWFTALTAWITVSWLLGLDPAGDYPQWDKVMKVNLVLLLGLALMRTKEHIVVFVWVATLSVALLASKGGLFTILNGGSYRVWGPPGSFIEGNNEFAVATTMTIPLLYFMRMQATQRWLRHGLLALMVLGAAAALGSHSRGALLAMAAMALLLWWRGRSRVVGGVVIALLGFGLVMFMPDHWMSRMETIQTYEADDSAQGRFSAWWVAWGIAKDYVAGVGFNAARPELFSAYSPMPERGTPVAHSIWFQFLGHHGFVGLALFIAVWISTWRAAERIRRLGRGHSQAQWAVDLAGMCQVSLVGYWVGGSFLQLGYWDLPYYVMGVVALTEAWVRRRAWESEESATHRWMVHVGARSAGSPRTATSVGRAGSAREDSP